MFNKNPNCKEEAETIEHMFKNCEILKTCIDEIYS